MLVYCDKKPDCQLSYQGFQSNVYRTRNDPAFLRMLDLQLGQINSFFQRPAGSPSIQSYFAAGDVVLIDLTDPLLDGELLSFVIGCI